VDTARLQRTRATEKHLEKRSGAGTRNVDSGLQVQREEDGCSNTRQSWIELMVCSVLHGE